MPRIAAGRFWAPMGAVNPNLANNSSQHRQSVATSQEAAHRSPSVSAGSSSGVPWLLIGAIALAGGAAWYVMRR